MPQTTPPLQPAPEAPTPPLPGERAAWLGGTLCAATLAWLLLRLLFFGQAQSFDSMLYARSLWGVAHGEASNPVIGLHVFAIHAHFLMVPLAPFARVLPAAAVLAVAQALAFGAVFTLAARAAARALVLAPRPQAQVPHEPPPPARARPLTAAALSLVFALLAVVASPLIANPFLFDVRPDLLGVPFLVAGVLRAVERGGFDRRALLWLLGGALAREELALVAASALLFAPRAAAPSGAETATQASATLSWRARALAAAAFAFYFAFYYFVVRRLLGGTDASAAAHLAGASGGTLALGAAKLELVVLIAATAGGLPWLGLRWAGAALPGIALLLVSRWNPGEQLSFHYGLFAAPGLLAAAIAGLPRLQRARPRVRKIVLLGAVVVSLGGFLRASAAPGGGRFAAFNFDLADRTGRLRLDPRQHSPGVAAAHAALAQVPADHGLALPWKLGARAADRRVVMPVETLGAELSKTGQLPPGLMTVALLRNDVADLGRYLVFRHGFRLAGPRGPLTLLTRDPTFAPIPWQTLGARPAPGGCASPSPLRRWPEAGLVLCEQLEAAPVPRVRLQRTAAAMTEAARTSVHVSWRPRNLSASPSPPARTTTGRAIPFLVADGLVTLAALPLGSEIELRAAAAPPATPGGGEVILIGADGREIPAAPAP